MKRIILAAVVCLALNACKDSKADEKAALNDVIKIHDKVMADEEKLVHNKMKLDTLFKLAQNQEAKTKIKELTTKLVKADSLMGNWMEKFDAEQKGKSHGEIMTYLGDQKQKVMTVDSLMSGAVKESDEYLLPFKK